jgi:uncharacterized protein YgbK (DUF1537 family)
MLPRWMAPSVFGRSGDLPPLWPSDPFPEIAAAIRAAGRKIVVLDDDPTGTQTVHDVAVLTRWDIDSLDRELRTPAGIFYVLTNSRSLSEPAAVGLTREIALNLRGAALRTGADLALISRSDSTLRGHFPAEMDALAGTLQQRDAPWLIVPFFEAGGRQTIGDVQYVAEGGRLTPVGETAFARDAVFGYRNSNLRAWVEEKTNGRICAESVHSVTLDHIRIGGPDAVHRFLNTLPAASVCIVNAANIRDLETFMLGLLWAEGDGRRFLYRTAASFAALRAGIRTRAPLQIDELDLPKDRRGGLVIVGSHVERTTAQLQMVLAHRKVQALGLTVENVLKPTERKAEVDRIAAGANVALRAGEEVVIHTSRNLVRGTTAEQNLRIAQAVSEALIAVVRQVSVRPRYLLAKGGITSSDIAVKALGVERAIVRGQLLPGVPVWRLEAPARWPNLTYVVFPGNVGDDRALLDAMARLEAPTP